MDATVQLALMAKANQIFPNAGQFLSFPALSPLTYQPEQLRFAAGRFEKQDWLDFSEFSRVVNRIPRGPLYDLSDDTYLWDVYGGILESAELPGQPPTATEEAEYQRALAYLYVTSPEGVRGPSEAARKYGWYRDAVLVAEQDYAGKQISAQYADPDAKERWEALDGPMLRRQIDMLKADWETKGFRKEVEAARLVERQQAALQYSAAWTQWQSNTTPISTSRPTSCSTASPVRRSRPPISPSVTTGAPSRLRAARSRPWPLVPSRSCGACCPPTRSAPTSSASPSMRARSASIDRGSPRTC